MTTLTHKSPLGPLEIPGVLGLIDPGAPFELPQDEAFTLLDQGDLYEIPGGLDALTVDELHSLAEHRGIDLTGVSKKKDIVAAIAAGPKETGE